MRTRSGPIENLRIGDASVTIYSTPSKKNGQDYRGFTAYFEQGGQHRRIWRSSKERLHRELQGLFGDREVLTLSGPGLREYERARRIASDLDVEIDEGLLRLKRLNEAAQLKGSTVEEALSYYARHHDQSKFSIPTPQVVEDFLADRGLMGNSKEDLATLRCHLRRFAGRFSCPLREITKDEYRDYFAAMGRSLRDRRNHMSSVGRLVNWAKNRDFLPTDHPGIPRTGSRVRLPSKRVEVFDCGQRDLLLAQARPIELPLTLLRAYVPIRSKECALVSWEDINWKTATLTVYADSAKKRESRSVSLVPELVARLEPYRRPAGRLYPYRNFYVVGPRLAARAGIPWIKNGWRCSVISHLQAFVRDLGRVADEAGNSPQQIRKHYLKNLDPVSGRAWFGLQSGQHHPLEPVRQVIDESDHRIVPIEPALRPANVIPFASVANHR